MLKTVKEMFTKMQPTLPVLVMVGALTSTGLSFLLLVPILLELIEWGYKTIKQRTNECTLDVLDRDLHHNRNQFFRIITFVLEHHNFLALAKNIRNDHIITNTNDVHKIGTKVWNFETPVIEPGSGFKILFNHDNFSVQIELIEIEEDKGKKTKYTISAKNQADLNAFITYANGLQLQYARKIYHD